MNSVLRNQDRGTTRDRQSFWHKQQAQSLIEVALFVPIFTLLLCYAVDVGYFYLAAASLSSSARNAGEYSAQGNAAAASSKLPSAGPVSTTTSVAALAINDISSLFNASVTASVYVCSDSIITSSNPSRCAMYGAANSNTYTADTDPESSLFHLNRVDVIYTISPPIPLGFLGTSLSLVPTSFHRSMEMRSIN